MGARDETMPLIVTGMAMEAELLRGSAARVIIGAGDGAALERKIAAEIARQPAPILSFGIAGGLAPWIDVGACVIPDLISAGGQIFACDEGWVERLRRACGPLTTRAGLGGGAQQSTSAPRSRLLLEGQDQPVASSADKTARHAASGALAADMESHVVARLASLRSLPFAVLRVVSDSAKRDLPPAALVPMRANGRPDMAAILRSVSMRPHQIGALLSLSRDLTVAMRALRTARAQLSATFAYSAAI